jgi:hypothetical protein
MSKNKRQRRFDKILNDLCKASAELSIEHMKALDRNDINQAEIYADAQALVRVAIKLIDSGCNPRFVATAKEAKHG